MSILPGAALHVWMDGAAAALNVLWILETRDSTVDQVVRSVGIPPRESLHVEPQRQTTSPSLPSAHFVTAHALRPSATGSSRHTARLATGESARRAPECPDLGRTCHLQAAGDGAAIVTKLASLIKAVQTWSPCPQCCWGVW